jgi:hypothetical protein
LIDHLDPLTASVGGRGEFDFLAVEDDPPLVGNYCSGEDLAQRRLASAVVADEAEHLAGTQDQIDAIERCDRIMVMYEGRNVAERPIDQTSIEEIVNLIVGRKFRSVSAGARPAGQE